MRDNVIHCGDCQDIMAEMESNSVDSIVTDPPYGISFMSKKWDYDVPSVEIWRECLRVLKPGGHLLSFSGTRTYHRMAVAIEDAGFEIRDMIAWVYGSGFPKSHNIGKAVDKILGNERDVVGSISSQDITSGGYVHKEYSRVDVSVTKGTSDWEGWGTAIKPAQEPIVLARKPLSEKTIALNVLKWGTGGINIDGCRINHNDPEKRTKRKSDGVSDHINPSGWKEVNRTPNRLASANPQGRFPANFIHDGSQEVLDLFPDTKSGKMKQHIKGGQYNVYGKMYPREVETIGDSGSASRFFYQAKASKRDRDEGLEDRELRQTNDGRKDQTSIDNPHQRGITYRHNFHPTVKPTKLMEYLVKLVTPPNGTVLDPYCGSGSTGKGCVKGEFNFVGVDMTKEYCDISEKRIRFYLKLYNKNNFKFSEGLFDE